MQNASPTLSAWTTIENDRPTNREESSTSNRTILQDTTPPRFLSFSPSLPISDEISRRANVASVLVPSHRLAYTPNCERPLALKSASASTPAVGDAKSRNTIISRYLLEDGTITFAVALSFDDSDSRDKAEVPLEEILNYVLPEELARFETTEFLREDADEATAERLAALRKPIGRPVGWRADMGLSYAQFVARNGVMPDSQQRENLVEVRPAADARQSKRGRPSRRGGPSFNGPKPLKSRSTDEESSAQELSRAISKPKARRGRPRLYSMVAAAGINAETSPSTEFSPDRTPSPSASVQIDAGGPPSRKRRIVFGKSPSPELQLSSSINAPAYSDNDRFGAGVQPKVVIPYRANDGGKPENGSGNFGPPRKRRCQRCIRQRQRCEDGRPCQRCYRAGIGADDCIFEADVKASHQTNGSAAITTDLNTPSSGPVSHREDVGTLLKSFDPLELPNQNGLFPHASRAPSSSVF